MQPQLKMKHKVALMNIEDNSAFMPNSEDLKTLYKQLKKKRYREKTAQKSMRTGNFFDEQYWDGGTDQLPIWYSEENELQRQIEMQLKDKASGEDEDEIVIDDSKFDKKNFVTNEQLQRIFDDED
jgi:hypothetical protein